MAVGSYGLGAILAWQCLLASPVFAQSWSQTATSWWSLVLEYGTPERPWPTTMSDCSCRGTVGWLGPQAYSTPFASNGIKMVHNAASASVHSCPSVRRHMWWYSREWVRGGLIGRGNMLHHSTSAVPRTSGIADVSFLTKMWTLKKNNNVSCNGSNAPKVEKLRMGHYIQIYVCQPNTLNL